MLSKLQRVQPRRPLFPAAKVSETKFGVPLPLDIQASVRKALHEPAEKHLQSLKEFEILMDRIKESGSRQRTDDLLNQAPPHVKEVQGHIDFMFMTELAHTLGLKDEVSAPSWGEYWARGAPMNLANLPPTKFFRKRDEPKRSAKRKFKSWMEVPVKKPKKPFEFIKRYNLERAWKEFLPRIEKGQLEEINVDKGEKIPSCPIMSFGVEQGEYTVVEGIPIFHKLRSCWDFRAANAYCDQVEHLEFWDGRVVQNIVNALITGRSNPETPVKQSKKDGNLDKENELRDSLQSTVLTDADEGTEWVRPEAGARQHSPVVIKLDKKAYYNQFANRDPEACVYAMFDTDEERFRYEGESVQGTLV